MTSPTLRLRPDKIASVCLPFAFGPYLTVRSEPEVQEGAALVARVMSERSSYGELELQSGRLSRLVPGDIVVGTLGNRAALRGFSGRVPASLAHGDEISLLNMGGVIGATEGRMVGLGEPIRLQALGAPLVNGRPALLSEFALPAPEAAGLFPKVIAVAGTCMNSGKSTAAAAVIRRLCAQGKVVNAGKATGVAAIRDVMSFRDHGAAMALSFLDCGIPSTAYHSDTAAICAQLLGHLAAEEPDVIVLELGDGLMGAYGVDEILSQPQSARMIDGVLLAANDVVGAWAGVQTLRSWGHRCIAVTGPATDNLAGVWKLESLGQPAANIMREPDRLFELVEAIL